MESKKIHILDSLRGIIALFIVVYHFMDFESHFGRVVPESGFIRSILNPLLEGSVSAFFIISSYVIFLHLERCKYRLNLFGKFILKRFLRLHLPILACILSIILVNNAFNIYLGNDVHFSLTQFLANLSLTAPMFNTEWYNPILWTLAIEFQFYFFIALTFNIIKRDPFLAFLLLNITFLVINYQFEFTNFLSYYGTYFITGMALYLKHQKRLSLVQFLVILSIGAFDLILNHPFLYPVIPLLAAFVILQIQTRFKFMEWLGNLSYSFYLMHGLFGGWFLYFIGRYANSGLTRFGVIFLAVVISFGGSYLFYRIIERPAHKLSSKIRY